MNQASMYDLTLSQAVDLITAIGTKRTVLVEGHMGSGKTSMLKMLAKKFPDHVPVYFDCTTKDLMDLGAPKVVRHEETGHEYLTMVPNEELGLHFDKPIILLFDEIGKKRSIIDAIRRILLERAVYGKKLHPDSIVIATTNLGAENLGDLFPPHSRNAITVVRVRKSTAQEWVDNFAINANIHHTVMAWALETPQIFQSFEEVSKPDDPDPVGNPYIYHPQAVGRTAFITHRSMEAASDYLHVMDKMDATTFQAALTGTIGLRGASDLTSYINISSELPSLQDIKENPKSAKIPASSSAVCMVVMRTLATLERSWVNAWMDYMVRLDNESQALFALAARNENYKHRELVMTNAKFTQWSLANQHLSTADKK